MSETTAAQPAARVKLDASWKARMGDQFETPEMLALSEFLRNEKQAGKVIYPRGNEIFAALDSTPFDQVKVVILGQDPYHGPGQAHGLSFSVRPGVAIPPSLLNIYKEISRDLDLPRPDHGYLMSWATQGVLLLNAVLTVEQAHAGSHQGKGWEGFTDAIIDALNREREHLVFLLWGSYAQAKGKLIDTQRHLVLKAPHPSPLSAHRGFLGCGHFHRVNDYLSQHQLTPIDWSLPMRSQLDTI